MGVCMDALTKKMETNTVEAIDILSARVELTQEQITRLTNVVESHGKLIDSMYKIMQHDGK